MTIAQKIRNFCTNDALGYKKMIRKQGKKVKSCNNSPLALSLKREDLNNHGGTPLQRLFPLSSCISARKP